MPAPYSEFRQGEALMDGQQSVLTIGCSTRLLRWPLPPNVSHAQRYQGSEVETCPRSHTEKEVELRHHPDLSAPGLEFCL